MQLIEYSGDRSPAQILQAAMVTTSIWFSLLFLPRVFATILVCS